MPTYVMLTNLTADGVKTLKSNPTRVSEVNKEVEALGAKVIDQYAVLGRFDFITVVEAPDPGDDGEGFRRARLTRHDDFRDPHGHPRGQVRRLDLKLTPAPSKELA